MKKSIYFVLFLALIGDMVSCNKAKLFLDIELRQAPAIAIRKYKIMVKTEQCPYEHQKPKSNISSLNVFKFQNSLSK